MFTTGALKTVRYDFSSKFYNLTRENFRPPELSNPEFPFIFYFGKVRGFNRKFYSGLVKAKKDPLIYFSKVTMCILFIHTDPNPQPNGYRVIIISNRDEFYARPSQQISRVKDVIGGRDLEPNRSGGMWLGVSVQQTENFKFRFGALLNVTGEEHKHGVKGRGFIVTDYLEGDNIAEKYMSSLINSEEEYNGFNFVAVEVSQNGISTHYCSNISKSYTRYVGKQVLGFGNTVLETPLKKVLAGTENFKMLIEECSGANDKDKLVEKLLYLLKWKKRHLPDSELQRRQPSWYEGLSSLFVNIPNAGYGSRTHSIILIDYNWNMEFFEATMKEPININDPTWLTDAIKARL